MEQTNKPNQNLIFPEDTSDKISNILKKYGLEESEEELDKKIFEENTDVLRGAVIAKIAANIIKDKMNDSEVVPTLKKELNITQDLAENIANDIKKQIIPSASPSAVAEKSVIIKNQTVEAPPKKIRKTAKNIIEKTAIEEPEEKSKLPEKPIPQEKPKSSGPDKYREQL
jgi:hypothetical protein